MSKQFIGSKKIAEIKETGDSTPSGSPIKEIIFEDGSISWFSELMLQHIISDQKIDDTQLRDRRLFPVVQVVLAVLRDYGMKTGETPYFSALLNQSLNNNIDEATRELWSKFMPKPRELDDVDLITVDRVLKTIKPEETSGKE
jgi:hypothetical protein